MNSQGTASVSDAELASIVCVALERSTSPVSMPQLRKALTGPFKVSAERLIPVLDSLQYEQKIFRCGTLAKPSYWNRDPFAEARNAMLATAQTAPQPLTALKDAVSKASVRLSVAVIGTY